MRNVHALMTLCLVSGCAFVEVREGDRVTRGIQFGGIAPSADADRPVSVKRWVAGLWASPGNLSVGLVREVAWVVPLGESCLFQEPLGESPAGVSR